MSNVYAQHRAAFASVSAYVVLHEGRRVATLAFKYPRNDASRLYAYVHWLGTPMVRGFAAGGGYDKHSAACAAAAGKLTLTADDLSGHDAFPAFRDALAKNDGFDWRRNLIDAGFTVLQAV